MRTQLPPAAYAVLGFLAGDPASGYDLKLAARVTVSHFWAANDNQIYPMLDRLEQESLVRSRRVSAGGRREKTVFRITTAGEAALDDWLRETPKPATMRHPGLIRLFFAWRLEDDDIARLIDHRRGELEQDLRGLRQLHPTKPANRSATSTSQDRRAQLMTLVLEAGIEITEAELHWWNRARQELLPERARE